MRRPAAAATLALATVLAATPARAATAGADEARWLQPPDAILEVLRAPETPSANVSPDGGTILLVTPRRYPPLSDLARPMLRLAGVRVDPRANAHHVETHASALSLMSPRDGRERPLALPPDAQVTRIRWAADGTRFAFANRTPDALELWIADVATATARRVDGVRLNPLLGSEVQWLPDQRTLLVKRVPPDRGPAPERPATPAGPRVLESAAGTASSTYEARDVLSSPHDEALFEHHALSQLATVDAGTGAVAPVGAARILASVSPSPDGAHLLVETLHRPWSYLTAWWRFPTDIEVWDRAGRLEHVVARVPLADRVPIHGVREGPRDVSWRQTAPATLVWAEALDRGDWSVEVPHRDRIVALEAPFDGEPRELHRAVHRAVEWWWGDRPDLLVVAEYERARRWQHAWALDPSGRSAPRKIFDLSVNDAYADPGTPVEHVRPDGARVLVQDGDAIFLTGQGATPAGNRPFLDRFTIGTRKAERLFRSAPDGLERFEDFLDAGSLEFLTRRESPSDPPQYVVRRVRGRVPSAAAGEAAFTTAERRLTSWPDPVPTLRGITKRIVTYERADGTPLSFTLYLPPGHVDGQRHPTVLYAYPLEYSDKGTAGQVTGSDKQFTRFFGPTHLFFLLAGYAVLHDATMPVIGDPDTAYDTFVEQLVADAEAAVAKAVELGVTDPERVGIMGHSHGALMAATLLAHSDVFRAGIARSGAYNHTMRPFGFQSERRTLWKARDTYTHLSPVMHADRIDEPLLLIHGEVDQNPGTVPLQSEKLFEAVRGTGGTVRLVMLPHESHGYVSREAVEHVIAEQVAWFDAHVKNAKPRPAESAAAQ